MLNTQLKRFPNFSWVCSPHLYPETREAPSLEEEARKCVCRGVKFLLYLTIELWEPAYPAVGQALS